MILQDSDSIASSFEEIRSFCCPVARKQQTAIMPDSGGKGTDLTSGEAREMILSLDKEVRLPPHITEEETTEGMKTPVFHSFHSFVSSYLPT